MARSFADALGLVLSDQFDVSVSIFHNGELVVFHGLKDPSELLFCLF